MTTKNLTIVIGRDGYTSLSWQGSQDYSFVFVDAEMVSNLPIGIRTFRALIPDGSVIQVNDNTTATPPAPVDPVPARYATVTWPEQTEADIVGYQVWLDGLRVADRDVGGVSYEYRSGRLESGAHTIDVYSYDGAGNVSPMNTFPFDIEAEPNPIRGIDLTDGSAAGSITLEIVAPDGI